MMPSIFSLFFAKSSAHFFASAYVSTDPYLVSCHRQGDSAEPVALEHFENIFASLLCQYIREKSPVSHYYSKRRLLHFMSFLAVLI